MYLHIWIVINANLSLDTTCCYEELYVLSNRWGVSYPLRVVQAFHTHITSYHLLKYVCVLDYLHTMICRYLILTTNCEDTSHILEIISNINTIIIIISSHTDVSKYFQFIYGNFPMQENGFNVPDVIVLFEEDLCHLPLKFSQHLISTIAIIY